MEEQQKLDQLASLLKDIIRTSYTPEVDDSNFSNNIQFIDNIEGKGLLWHGRGYNKQLIFAINPDRFFLSENLDLAREKYISINNLPVLSQSELGNSVTKSSLREVGRLKGLLVDGSVSINNYLFYDANTDRLGIGTDNPKKVLNLIEENVEIVIGASESNVGCIGTFSSQNFEIHTDSVPRITVEAGGNITLGHIATGPVHVNVLGKLTVNVNNPDQRASLHVNGAIKFNNKLHLSGTCPPSGGSFSEGDIVWNSEPNPGGHIGWVCIKAGNPGIWNPFGRID